MEEVFLKILNMSIAACWIILAVAAARFLLKKAPKWIAVAMWGIAGLRLVCPFTIESVLSLIPSAETVPSEILYTDEPAIHTGVPFVNEVVNPVIYETLAPTVENTVKPAQSAASVAAVVWVVGVGLMLAYMAISFIRVYMQVREAAFQKDNVWVCDKVDTPFVLGVFRPRIYLPSTMSEEDMGYVIAHEKAHLKRRDNWWKPTGFLVLAVHWFNPLVWLAYILLCRDIEFACDEKVIKALSVADRKAYSNALINCSAPRRVISACPLAFGENGVKSRIKSVLNYKKPAFWIILIAVIACVVVAVCFLTNPKTKPGNDSNSDNTSPSTSGVFVNNPQEFTQAFDKLSMTLTTDKTEYVLGEDKVAEVTATVKNTSGEKIWLYSGYTGGKNFLLRTTLELPGTGISLQDLDGLLPMDCAIEEKLLNPGEEYVQKMRFDLTGEGYHPLTNQLLPPVEPGEYQGKCAGVFHTDPESVNLEECSLDFKIVVKQSPSIVLTNDPQKFSKTYENLAMTITTDKTAYFLGEDKIAEVTATVKNVSGKTLWLHCNNTGRNIMLPTLLGIPGSEIELIDLDRSYMVEFAHDEVKLEPGEEYVQKMRFDLVREGLSPATNEPLVPAKPGVYRGGCTAIYAFNESPLSDSKGYHLNFQILLKERNPGVFVNSSQKFTQAFDKLSFTVTTDKTKYVLGEDKIAQVTAVVKNTSDKSIFLYCGDLGQNHMIYTELKHWINEMNLFDLDSDFGGDDAIKKVELKPGEEYTQVMRFDLVREEINQLTLKKPLPAEPGWYLGTCQVRYFENRDDNYSKPDYIGFRIALVNDINDDPNEVYAQENDKTNSDAENSGSDSIIWDDIDKVLQNYKYEEKNYLDWEVVDLDFNENSELLVLVEYANVKEFDVWEKNDGKMEHVFSFGGSKINYINEISLTKSEYNGKRMHLFSFSYPGSHMKADEVLAAIVKTEYGYDVEYLLSRGTIAYPDIEEPFSKEFYRKGWGKYDINMNKDYGDISKEEYIELYKEYTGTTPDL